MEGGNRLQAMTLLIPVLLVCLLAATAAAAYFYADMRRWRGTAQQLADGAAEREGELQAARQSAAEKEAEASRNGALLEMQRSHFVQANAQLEERFRSLAADALHQNSRFILDRSREGIRDAVEPIHQSLAKFDAQVQAIELKREGAYGMLTNQVTELKDLQERVRTSTDQLKTALRSPIQRGRWGEIQLRRVVEMAGMLEYCDFSEQETLFGTSLGERNQRPDLIVRLPNQCRVVVDSKVSLEAYLRAIESHDEADRVRHLGDHARQVKTHIKALGEKGYWERLPCSPEFVIAFLPLESLFSAALDAEPTLLDYASQRKVVLATPSTLIALLLTVAHGWRGQALAEDVEKIRDVGKELYNRLLTMYEPFGKLGSALERAVAAYNDTTASFDNRVLPGATRLGQLARANSKELGGATAIDGAPRALRNGAPIPEALLSPDHLT